MPEATFLSTWINFSFLNELPLVKVVHLFCDKFLKLEIF